MMLGAAFNSIAGFDDGSGITNNFKDVLGHNNQQGWWESMKREFNAMETKGYWKIMPMSFMPSGRKIVGNRWVYSEKSDGTLRSRTVAQGFIQVPGKAFTDSHAPVMTDLAFRLALIIKVLMKLRTGPFVIETAFLYSDLEEEIYMRISEGYSKYMLEVHNTKIDSNTHVLLLKKAIYGLVQTARQWWKNFKEVMAMCNYFPSKSDPCLFFKKAKEDEPLSFVIIYVDDGGTIGTPDAIKEVISALGKSFKVKTMGEIENFVGCKIIETVDKDGVWIHQPKLLKNLKENFASIVADTTRIFKTPSVLDCF
jgi:Reverse transcriptase (RNA-dependent DNA polymerase)